jgi:glycine/D-amino acid oxidase-like deaminating enzyme
MNVVIVGAGTFGASLAWWLARSGDRVTIVDQLEPGDRRASSGGETRLYRCSHGFAGDYTAMARRARTLWRELEEESGEEVFVECGVAWFAHRDDGWEARSEQTLAAQSIPVDRLEPAEAEPLYPSLRTEDLAFVLLEPEAGVLRAQRAVRALVVQAERHGARRLRARAHPEGRAAVLDDGTQLDGDVVVWACGAWVSRLFPEHITLAVTRQEQLYFDGGGAWCEPTVPAWCDYDRAFYGTADIDALGMKAASDALGVAIEPDAELTDEPTTEPHVRAYLRERFPALADAPLRSSQACRYELTADTHFVVSRHPDEPAVWLVGGGSGHGFKHGPALAERLAAAIRDDEALPPHFALGQRKPSTSLRTASSSGS